MVIWEQKKPRRGKFPRRGRNKEASWLYSGVKSRVKQKMEDFLLKCGEARHVIVVNRS